MAELQPSQESDTDDVWQDYGDWEDVEENEPLSFAICICKETEKDDEIIYCESQTCEIEFFHKTCVGSDGSHDLASGPWLCEDCAKVARPPTPDQPEVPTEPTHCDPTEKTKKGKSIPGKKAKGKKDQPEVPTEPTHPTEKTKKGKSIPGKKNKGKKGHPSSTTAQGPQFTMVKATSMAVVLFMRCLQIFFSDPLYLSNIPKCEKLRSFAQKLMESAGDTITGYAKKVVGDLWNVIFTNNQGPTSNTLRGKMWNKFHRYRCDDMVKKSWQDLLIKLNIHSLFCVKLQLFMLQHILEFLLKLMIEEFEKCDLPEMIAEGETFIVDRHEEQVLRYVAGYIPFALKRRFAKVSAEYGKVVLDCLNSMSVAGEGKTFLEYSKKWVNMQNRGGLFVVNDSLFLFFKTLEFHTKKHLNIKRLSLLRNENVKRDLSNFLFSVKQIQQQFDGLVKDTLNPDMKKELLMHFINYWTKLRINAFVKMYMEIRKNSSKVGKKGEKPLRKELKN